MKRGWDEDEDSGFDSVEEESLKHIYAVVLVQEESRCTFIVKTTSPYSRETPLQKVHNSSTGKNPFSASQPFSSERPCSDQNQAQTLPFLRSIAELHQLPGHQIVPPQPSASPLEPIRLVLLLQMR